MAATVLNRVRAINTPHVLSIALIPILQWPKIDGAVAVVFKKHYIILQILTTNLNSKLK